MRDLYPDERLLENFLEQELVARDRVVAEKLVELTKDQIIELSKNGQLYTTGDTRGLNLYFILSGSVELQNDEGEKAYWLSKTPYERLDAVETMRQIIYGYDPATTRLQRIFEVTQRA